MVSSDRRKEATAALQCPNAPESAPPGSGSSATPGIIRESTTIDLIENDDLQTRTIDHLIQFVTPT